MLAYGGALAWYTLERFDLFNMVRDGYTDDAFYYFQIAYHMAEGRFSTFDGLTRTNGYHPLWLLLITPFYWVFDKVEALFAIKALEIMLTAVGMALVAAAARTARLPWILLFAALPALYAQAGMRLGMEAALVLFMLGLLMLAMCLFARDPARWRWLLATTAFAMPWVRLEWAAVAVAATAAMGVFEWSGQLPCAPAAARKHANLNAVVPLASALAGIFVYFVYNGIVFGGVLPVSAVAKQMWSQRRWNEEGGWSLLGNFRDLIAGNTRSTVSNVWDDELVIAFEVGVYALLVWWLSRRSGSGDPLPPPTLAFMLGVFALGVGHMAKFAQSVLTMHPFWAFYNWYFAPAHLMEALVVPVRCYVAICAVQRFVASRRAQAVLRLSIVACGLIALVAKTDLGGPFRFVDSSGHEQETTVSSLRVPNYLGTLAMNHLLPENSMVGSWDSGVIGYFSHLTVVNLDGLANSYDYLRASRKGILEVERQLGLRFTHFANIAPRRFDIHYSFQNRHPRPEPSASALFGAKLYASEKSIKYWFQIAAAEPVESDEVSRATDQAASFWERVRPHSRADDIALVLHGRVALAFRPDCAAEDVAEWSWDAVESRYASPWAPTTIGVCATAIVLPPIVPPVRVETLTVDGWLVEHRASASAKFRADFDVVLVENSLFFMKAECAPGDTDAVFFLHLVPADTDDLPSDRQQHGFDNLDFKFDDHVHWLNGRSGWCVAEVQLPNYRMAAIKAGQYVVEGEALRRIWEGEMHLEPQSGA